MSEQHNETIGSIIFGPSGLDLKKLLHDQEISGTTDVVKELEEVRQVLADRIAEDINAEFTRGALDMQRKILFAVEEANLDPEGIDDWLNVIRDVEVTEE